ncbi:MAG: nicotinate (nicotinamide) nucleotide adenylyltransferase, partial [Chloroflexi bacterium]|nr:nicotinate (nicotinamide) nucleotide adenylyltransferase [Chloroflexota bacterium]
GIAEEGRRQLVLERVLFIPAGQPWLKADKEITAASHRLQMLNLAIAGNPYFEISTIEVDRSGPSYAVDTMAALRQRLSKKAELYFFIGWDSLDELPLWKEPDKLVQLCHIVTFPRADYEKPDLAVLEKSIPRISQRVVWVDVTPVDISSSDIRARVAKGLPISRLVPEAVARYIAEHKLYR